MRRAVLYLLGALFIGSVSNLSAGDIPTVLGNIRSSGLSGSIFFVTDAGDTLPLAPVESRLTLDQMRSLPIGTDSGLAFDFCDTTLNGTLYYGFIPDPEEVKHAYPVFFNQDAPITRGRAAINIAANMGGEYDFVGWQTTGQMRFGYRIVDERGGMLYDGKICVRGVGPFLVDTSIIEGPFVNILTDTGAVISFQTSVPVRGAVLADGCTFDDPEPRMRHEIAVSGLDPATVYDYTVVYGPYRDSHSFRTAPKAGSRQPFVFAYASDGRGNNGGGERDLRGVNAYILKKLAALATARDARFVQFTGDLVEGYGDNAAYLDFQYANWRRTVEPFAHYLPFVAGFGNHECLLSIFTNGKRRIRVDRFPYQERSAEACFARNVVNPVMGPVSEDGSSADPDPDYTDFPPYAETIYYYTYDNVAMIVLNSAYWFSVSLERYPESGGNLHGYIMDNQLAWLAGVLDTLERDGTIDHIFVTLHTPIFPNGGHVAESMWYAGDNSHRPTVAGKPVERGIIERRDQLLDLLVNRSSKVIAALTGDEHNYNALRLTADTPIYPEDWAGPRLALARPLWQINNGAAGAPYYGRETTPWEKDLHSFSTQNALVLLHVDGKSVRCEVVNPDTMEPIDEFEL